MLYISRKICIFLQDGYSLGDIFILAPSIRSGKSPVLHLSNYLSNKGYKIYTAANDKDDLDDREIRENKIICCSFHQSKGRERAIVIVMGFDDSLFEYYNQDRRDNPEKCPNRIYVAITRGKDHLFLVHDCKKKFLPFLGKEIFEICDLKQITREPIMEPKKMEKKEYSVNQLASHLSARSILELEQYFTVSQIKPPRYNIKIKSTVLIASSKENIRHIFETAILLLKSSEMKVRYNGILKYLEHCLTQKVYKEDFTMHLRKAINVLEKETKSYEDIAFLSNLYCCLNDGYVHPLNQITSYEWFPAQKIKIKQCLKELEFLKETDQIKVEVSDIFKVNNFEIKISGIIDCCFKNGNIWEIKCLSAIKTEDIFRLVVYACLDNNQREYYLFNVLSGEILKIEIPDENTKLFMKYIIGKKFEIAEGSIPLEKMISDIIS